MRSAPFPASHEWRARVGMRCASACGADNKLGDKIAAELGKALMTNTTLLKLNLARASALAQPVACAAVACRPRELRLCGAHADNEISDKGAAELGTALMTNTTLQSLDLNGSPALCSRRRAWRPRAATLTRRLSRRRQQGDI